VHLVGPVIVTYYDVLSTKYQDNVIQYVIQIVGGKIHWEVASCKSEKESKVSITIYFINMCSEIFHCSS
jgi:hypothetical protein